MSTPFANPFHAQHLQRAIKQYESGQAISAIQTLDQIFKEDPNHVRALGLVSACLSHIAKFEQALEAADRALKVEQSEPLLYTLRARALRMLGRTDDAIEAFQKAMALEPEHRSAAANIAVLLLALRRHDEAYASIEPWLDREDKGHQIAIACARCLRHRKEHARGIEILRRAMEDPGIQPGARHEVLFTLADLLDGDAQYAEAWSVLVEANKAHPAVFDSTAFNGAVDRILQGFSKEQYDKMESAAPVDGDGGGSLAPVFVLGLPRSGTTLVERILSAHPAVFAGSELETMPEFIAKAQAVARPPNPHLPQLVSMFSKPVLDQLAQAYVQRLPAPPEGDPAHLVTDKLPANLLSIPVIRKTFPDAPIIRCKRDHRDTAISCFFQHFGSRIPWPYDLKDIKTYFDASERAYEHYVGELGIDVIEVEYEALVSDPEPRVREMLDAMGLDFDAACLEHHKVQGDARTRSVEQVTKPIYTGSVERWRRYETQLAGTPVMDLPGRGV